MWKLCWKLGPLSGQKEHQNMPAYTGNRKGTQRRRYKTEIKLPISDRLKEHCQPLGFFHQTTPLRALIQRLKGHWHQKVTQINISGDALGLPYEHILYLKIVCSSIFKWFLTASSYGCKNLFTCGHGPQINFIPRRGSTFWLISGMPNANARFLWCAVCSLEITIL
jgi:hypothetical protein